jgi:NADPH:quinone reductase-like Zn-dependent oxidoreductase
MAKRVTFVAKSKVAVEQFDLPKIGDNDVTIRAVCSLISTGTEGIILNQLFAPGTHWHNWLKGGTWPWFPGYALIGTVEAVGRKVTAWFAFAKITFMGARAAQYSHGDSVLIIGAGPIGQISVRWGKAAAGTSPGQRLM